ncbi:hypothetical protein [Rummeliibacillus pycnus]|uniref:hypothetical protein n=1 Tax=Rummeliibacillus pycnus TaxID=101070 RepID=UPI003D2E8E0F
MGNGPLLFIKTPPAFFKKIEEPKLTFIEEIEELNLANMGENNEETLELQETQPVIENGNLLKRKERLLFLSNPFQQKAYQPLVFVVNDGREIAGEVQNVNMETDEVIIRTNNDVVYPISISNLDDLLWRGRSFLS